MDKKAKEILASLSLHEKASMLSGKNFWQLKEFSEHGLDSIMLTDGPHGLRKQSGDSDHLGINNSEKATSFPTASLSACSFDKELLYEMGEALGDKCIREDVAVILGPGVNIKRSPLCGRNFEYFSEDPVLAGKMGAAIANGIQSKGVGASVKHFAANNQEYARMVNDSVVDERALREIYLTAFETVVKESQPWTVMCSYNKLNGTYASNNKWLLTDVLRNEWGYENLVVTDWGAMDDPVKGVEAGCDLEMPFSGDYNSQQIVKAVQEGRLSTEALDKCVLRVLDLYLKASQKIKATRSEEDDHNLARKIASESAVLLKNDSLLPISKDEKVLLVGEFSKRPRYQGAGSSKINPSFLDSIYEIMEKRSLSFGYRQGYSLEKDDNDDALIHDACCVAGDYDKVVVVVGLPDEYESEGFDRDSIKLPNSHIKLIEELLKINKNVIVVLQLGAVVELPFKDSVKSILLTYLSGQAGGEATVDLLYGICNPCGKLAETWPKCLEDTPSYKYYKGNIKKVEYKESIYVGYRYYDTVGCEVNYPFGYGLSYTDFEYSNLVISEKEDGEYEVSLDVKNIGNVYGKEIVELYVCPKNSKVFRAKSELKDFVKISLESGETKKVKFTLNKDTFRYYNTKASKYCVEALNYEICIGKSSRDFVLSKVISVAGDGMEELLTSAYKDLTEYNSLSYPINISDETFEKLLGRKLPDGNLARKGQFTDSSCLEEIKDTLAGKMMLKAIAKQSGSLLEDNSDEGMKKMAEAMLFQMPLRAMTMTGAMTHNQVNGLIAMANGHFIKGIMMMKNK